MNINFFGKKPAKLLKVCSLAVAVSSVLMSAHSQAEETLNLYNWSEYINPEIITKFTEETGIKVVLDTYSSNEEMLAKLQAGAKGYDLVFPSVHMQDIMTKLDLLEKTNINEYSGFSHIDKSFLKAKLDPNGEYCLPYAWGTVGIVYNKKLVPSLDSWEEFFALPEQGNKIAMLNDMREVIGVGLITHDKSVNSTDRDDLTLAKDYIIEQKPNVSSFTYDSIPLVKSGDLAAAQWYVGAMLYVQESPEELAYVIPKEGATMYQENMCVLKSAPNKANAVKFLEFFTQPEIAAMNAIQQTNGTANKDAIALLPDELRNNKMINPPEDVRAKLQIFEELGKGTKLYDRIWTQIRTN
ncbi:polyamine ABC transporter substrate-binding protein [Vibrio sp. WJH972]